jgi:calcium-dependent protein kinase
MMKTLLKAVNHCHTQGIAHRDLKPENIMVGDDGNLKLIDFGLSQQSYGESMYGAVGSAYYIAPEVMHGGYGLKCDVWSLGVILYIFLCGYIPFTATTTEKVLEEIKKAEITYDQPEWKKVSPEGMDLVKHMLEPIPKKRFSAAE